jgi:hypothetical protein
MNPGSILMDSLLALVPTTVYLFTIMELICFVIIVDFKNIGKTADGKHNVW